MQMDRLNLRLAAAGGESGVPLVGIRPPRYHGTVATILIADDDPTTVRLLAAAVQQAGHRVVTAMDAFQAVRAAHKEQPAAIIMDVMMPAGSGLNALKQIKASNRTQLIPVIAVSSSTDPDIPAKMLAAGADEFLPKPVDLQRLTETLSRLLPAQAP
jgi:CheY-like chemotaxis protein